jgi:hypothetical protein
MTIYLVACGKEKVQHSIKARGMYTGSYFKACLKYAESQSNDGIFILSAKYGLVELEEIIQPYDLVIGDDGSVNTDYIKSQATEKGILYENIIVLGGKKYVKFIQKIWPNATCPLSGGLLSQISWMNKQVEIEKLKKQMELWK